MLTSRNTTFVMLDKGIEDRALRDELNKLITEAGYGINKDFIVKYMAVHDLLCTLSKELESQEL